MPKYHQKVIEFGTKIDHESFQKLRRKTTRTNTENNTGSEQKRHGTERARSRINTQDNGFYWIQTKTRPFVSKRRRNEKDSKHDAERNPKAIVFN